MKYKLALVMSVLCAFSAWTEAKVKLPAILSDGMVLQRERPVKIWGNADKGENVTVVFKKKKFSIHSGIRDRCDIRRSAWNTEYG